MPGGDQDHRHLASALAQLLDQLLAVHPRHHVVGDDQGDGLVLHGRQRLDAVARLDDPVALRLEQHAHQEADVGLVVYDEDRRNAASRL